MSSKLVIECAGSQGTVKFSYNYANPEMTTATVKALATGLVTNNVIFANPPVTVKKAKLVTTTEGEYDLSD